MITSLFKTFDTPGAPSTGLPGAAYTESEFLQLEREYLFSRRWVLAGFAHDMLRGGDVQPVEVAGLPLLLVRDKQGKVGAFHNVCRHRNLKLVDEAGNCGKLIRCPYHSWSYDLGGGLKNAPYFGGDKNALPEGFKLADNGLTPVACEVWHDWIFVNLSAQPESFDAFLAPLKKMLGDNNVEDYVAVKSIDFGEVACNWKLLMENFIEPYHVQFVHRTTTRQPLEDHYTVIEDHCLGSAIELDEAAQAEADDSALGVTSHYLTLFPSFVLGTYQPDQLGVYLNEPLSADSTRQRRVIYVHKDSSYSEAQIEQMGRLWHSVHLEDHAMCRRLQLGRQSPMATSGGVLSPQWENSVRRFQELIADAVRPGLTD